MSFADDVHGVVLRVVELLESREIDYLMMGGIAVPIWGIPRATFDVDVTLSVDEQALREFIDAAKGAGFTIDEPFERGFRDVLDGMRKLRIEWWTASARRIEVDVFLVTTSYQAASFARRVRVHIDDREMWVLSAADLILHKLIANRLKHLADIQNVLAVQGVPDREYLRAWAEHLGVTSRLDDALSRVDS